MAALATLGAGRRGCRLRTKGQIVGTAQQIPAQLRELEAAGVQGVQGVMLQWVDDLDDIKGIAALGRAIRS